MTQVERLERPSPADIAAIVGILAASGWGTAADYPPDKARRFCLGSGLLYVARDEAGQVQGFLRGFTDGCFVSVLTELLVHPARRGRGHGRALIVRAEADLAGTTIYAQVLDDGGRVYAGTRLRPRPRLSVFAAAPAA